MTRSSRCAARSASRELPAIIAPYAPTTRLCTRYTDAQLPGEARAKYRSSASAAAAFEATTLRQSPQAESMWVAMCVVWEASGAIVRSRSAARIASSGRADISIRWMYRWLRTGWSGPAGVASPFSMTSRAWRVP